MTLLGLAAAGTACTVPMERAYIRPGNRNAFDYLEVEGSYYEIGFQTGRLFRKNIREVIRRREKWHHRLMSIYDTREGKVFADELHRLTHKHFPWILDEIEGMAAGAGLDFKAVWVMCIKSEIDAWQEPNPGCSTICVKDDKHFWLYHNEDGHAAYGDLMFMVRVTPPSGVTYLSMVYPGIITGNGPTMNDRGIIQTTNYIGSVHPEVGIPRYIIGRAVLEAKTLEEAVQVATTEPRAHPFHHNLAGIEEDRYLSVETIPGKHQVKEPKGVYFHTNHLVFEQTRDYPYRHKQYTNSSSLSRYEVLEEKLRDVKSSDLKPEDPVRILASHERAPYSPCRHPRGDVKGLTLGSAFFDIRKGRFRLYRGNPCQGLRYGYFHDYPLERL